MLDIEVVKEEAERKINSLRNEINQIYNAKDKIKSLLFTKGVLEKYFGKELRLKTVTLNFEDENREDLKCSFRVDLFEFTRNRLRLILLEVLNEVPEAVEKYVKKVREPNYNPAIIDNNLEHMELRRED